MSELSDMQPTSIEEIESEVQRAIHKLGKSLMEWKINEWDEGTGKEKCESCGGKLERHKRHRQILILVSDINCDRYMYYCPSCKKAEYPLDEVLGLSPYQRISPAVEELSVLCGAL